MAEKDAEIRFSNRTLIQTTIAIMLFLHYFKIVPRAYKKDIKQNYLMALTSWVSLLVFCLLKNK